MKVLNLIATLISATVVSNVVVNAAQAETGTWDGQPAVAEFEFNKNIGETFIGTVVVKTGELTTNYAQTETTVNYYGPTCDSNSRLVLNMSAKVYNTDDGSWSRANSSEFYAVENGWGKVTLVNSEYKTYPTNINLTVSERCENLSYASEVYRTGDTIAEETINAGDSISEGFYDVTDSIADTFGW
jgi:hypothetical protein